MPGNQPSIADAPSNHPFDEYLGDSERLCHVLTNQQMGVTRHGDEETVVRPADDRDAFAGLTDRRILLVVGDPEGYDGDFVTSHPYTDIDTAEVITETLTARLQFETAGGTAWSFTAREVDVDAVSQFLAEIGDRWSEVAALDDHCGALATHLEAGAWDEFDDRKDAAFDALATAREGDPTERIEACVRERARELHELCRDRYVRAGHEVSEAAQQRLDSEAFVESYDRARTAIDRFERALSVATTHGVDTTPAAEGRADAEELLGAVVGRTFAVAREQYVEARDHDDPTERVERLEAALDAYRRVARLVTAEDTGIRGETVREESEAVIATLVDALCASARQRRSSAHWEWDTGNEEAAYELFTAARDDLDRALELASSYPPGDPEGIRERRDDLVETADPLLIRYELTE